MSTLENSQGTAATPAPPAPPRQEMVLHLRFEAEDIEKIVSGVLRGVKVMIEEAEHERP